MMSNLKVCSAHKGAYEFCGSYVSNPKRSFPFLTAFCRYWTNARGALQFFQTFEPTARAPKGLICVCHGSVTTRARIVLSPYAELMSVVDSGLPTTPHGYHDAQCAGFAKLDTSSEWLSMKVGACVSFLLFIIITLPHGNCTRSRSFRWAD